MSADVRSGSPGFRRSSSGIDQHWQKKNVTVHLDPSLKKLGHQAEDAVMQAFGRWVASDPRLPALSFDTGNTSAEPRHDGKNTVSYAEIQAPGHENDLAITVTYSNDATGEILEADVVLNARYAVGVLNPKRAAQTDSAQDMQADDCRSRYDAQNVITHEAGHFFGLGEDMVEQRATMFLSIGKCEMHKRELATTDVGAISTLYSQAAVSGGADGSQGCSFGPSRSGPIWPALTAVVGLFGLRRRRRV